MEASSSKRPRLGDSSGEHNQSSGHGSLNEQTSLSSPNISNSGSQTREVCRYASNCYRRNEAHLVQFQHKLLEEAYRIMTISNDFTQFPESLDADGADEMVILEQATILRDAGFQISPLQTIPAQPQNPSPTRDVPIRSSGDAGSSNGNAHNNVTPVASSSAATPKDPLKDLFEERRRKMVERKEALERVKEKVKANKAQDLAKGVEGKTTPLSTTSRTMAELWELSSPFNFFLTKVHDIPDEKDGVFSANFTDLFDSSLGEVKAICHINFMVEANWFFEETLKTGLEGKPTWIIYGEENDELKEAGKAFPSLKLFKIKSPFPYGHHHTKMSFVQYTDNSLRFFVYTANLIESDWYNRTQGIWISPRCPRLPSGSPATIGDSLTKFRSDIMQYLSTYPVQATAAWRDLIKYTDCSNIRVFFIGSAPITAQSSMNGFQFGIKKMEKVLRSFEMDTEPNWPLTAQCSSIGTLGGSASDWLINEFGAALAGKDRTLVGPLKLVYPSDKNVKDSFDGVHGGGCLPYSAMTHMKQRWLDRHFCQWKAECSGRSRAPPHIKSYSRWSPDQSKMAWFLLTSANLSKAAWGKLSKHGDRLTVMSWEAGVLFVPELLVMEKYFTVGNADDPLRFPLHIDIPCVKYEGKDHPWFFETLKLEYCESD